MSTAPNDRNPPGPPNEASPWPFLIVISEALGEMKADMSQMKADLKDMKSTLDDLVKWKTMILGGVAVIVGLSGALVWVTAKYSITFVERPVLVVPR